MPHNNRPFDRQSYNQNDARAKKAMVSYLTAQNFSDIVDKEDYYFDVSASKKDKKFFFEVAIKNQWGSSWNASWKEVRISERKRRLINKKNKRRLSKKKKCPLECFLKECAYESPGRKPG